MDNKYLSVLRRLYAINSILIFLVIIKHSFAALLTTIRSLAHLTHQQKLGRLKHHQALKEIKAQQKEHNLYCFKYPKLNKLDYYLHLSQEEQADNQMNREFILS